MEAGPRDTEDDAPGRRRATAHEPVHGAAHEAARESVPDAAHELPHQAVHGTAHESEHEPDRLSPDGPDELDVPPEVEVELRPARRLRIWQLAPIVVLAAMGSLMFAFPLAFEFGDGGAVVAMLGLLISCCAAGWGMMAARRVGHTWPGLPPRGSGERPDWRVIALYVVLCLVLVVLAVGRVARLR